MSHRKDLLNIVLGNPGPFFNEVTDFEQAQKYLDVFKAHGFLDIDTARGYAEGEKNFGALKAASQGFTIDTKVFSFVPGAHKAESIHQSVKTSFELLGVSKVNILYLHAPDRATPFEETVRAIDELHKQGKFNKFGLSNYTAAEVAEIVAIADKNGFVRPTVYQGNYSILVRKGEAELFPLLKKEKIAFYAWSPLAGGLLTGRFTTKEQINADSSRFSDPKLGPIFTSLFVKDSFFVSLNELIAFIKKHNLSVTEVALRWLAYHSKLSKADGDAIILGASKPEQFDSSIKELERGPLPADVVAFVEKIWANVKDDSPNYHF